MLRLFLVVLSFLFVGQIIAQQKTEFNFSVSSLGKSRFWHRLTYYVNAKNLIIKEGFDIDFSHGKKPKKNIVVFQTKLDSSESLKLYLLKSLIVDDSLKSHYNNLCVMDGLILDFDFSFGNKTKSLSLSNYYVTQMQPFVEFVNMKVPKKYKIWYNQLDLEKLMKDCPKERLLEY